jgi:hypothetical protein
MRVSGDCYCPKGEELTSMEAFFEDYGTQSTVFAKNPGAIKAWMVNLMLSNDGSKVDNLPLLDWVQHMLKETDDRRFTADVLAKMTTTVAEHVAKRKFSGPRCRADGETPSSVDARNISPNLPEASF